MTYANALEAAIRAAKSAGVILYKDFYSPGGPRGSGSHADVDEEAESAIRDILRPYNDKWSIVGEELGREIRTASDDSERFVWVIDPNDGTRSYLKGWRGAAVSIALLRNCEPVLGVVFAYAARAGSGDLFAWAEGQPLTRNGLSIEPRVWPDALTTESIVIVSQAGDDNIEANATLWAPARFRCEPSIAYRLALVAAGEADAACSFNGPVSWDYAGGHALLIGAGGDLFDSNGRKIRYDSNGGGGCGGACFGGSPSIAPKLSSLSWKSVLRSSPSGSASQLIKPSRSLIFNGSPEIIDRAQGCIAGLLIGDSLGGIVEFKTADQIAMSYPDGVRDLTDNGYWRILGGQPTDDGELALMLARSLAENGEYNASAVTAAYAHWFRSDPFDIGTTTRTAFSAAASAVDDGKDPAVAATQAANKSSQANGGLMRIAPLGVFGWDAPVETLADWAATDSSLSHPHPVCRDANIVFVLAIQAAIRHCATPDDIYSETLKQANNIGVDPVIMDALIMAKDKSPADYYHQMGWVKVALQNAFYQLLHAKTMEAGIIDTVGRGGDTDTNGAIAGALLGAAYGIRKIPDRWLSKLLSCRPLKSTPTRHPRAAEFWPVDCLRLAERLLTARKGC